MTSKDRTTTPLHSSSYTKSRHWKSNEANDRHCKQTDFLDSPTVKVVPAVGNMSGMPTEWAEERNFPGDAMLPTWQRCFPASGKCSIPTHLAVGENSRDCGTCSVYCYIMRPWYQGRAGLETHLIMMINLFFSVARFRNKAWCFTH